MPNISVYQIFPASGYMDNPSAANGIAQTTNNIVRKTIRVPNRSATQPAGTLNKAAPMF